MNIRTFTEKDTEQVVELWHKSGLMVAWNDPREDIRKKMEFQPEYFYVGELDGKIVATCMAGYEGHRGWINYMAVDPDCRSRGFGSLILNHAVTELDKIGCLKINLQVRTSNTGVIDFYKKNGFKIDDVVGMGRRLS